MRVKDRRIVIAGLACLVAGCNMTPVTFTSGGDHDGFGPAVFGGVSELDVLWVISNAGSMCQEQAVVRENFAVFADQVSRTRRDFRVAVTATHVPDSLLGHLSDQPNPVPGSDRACHTAVDSNGEPIEGDYTPIRAAIDAAVDCMAEPDDSLRNPSDADIECAMYGIPAGCTISRAGCG